MKVTYDAPCPIENYHGGKGCILEGKSGKFEKQYAEIFHFAHSNKIEILIKVDGVKSFSASVLKTFGNIYPKFNFHKISDNEVMVMKKW